MRVERFAETAYERHAIYIAKTLGAPKPWSEERVYQKAFFCNVFRRIDKTTEWIMRNIATPLAKDDYLWASLVIARYVSRIDVLEDMKNDGAFDTGYSWDKRRHIAATTMLRRKAAGLPINTGAFITSPMLGAWGPTKAHYISNLVRAMDEDGVASVLTEENASMEEAWTALRKYRAVGSFMAYQYICDFSYVEKYLKGARDAYSWSAPGPGSLRGMTRILYNCADGRIAKDKWLDNARTLRIEWEGYIERTLPSFTIRMLERFPGHEKFVAEECDRFLDIRMQDVQHWLCEYDKYERGGSSKRVYYGGRDE